MKSKEQKRKEAQQRLGEWASLTTDEQIAELRKRPGNCRKQLNKIVRRSIAAMTEK
jgi:hypothetical protein